MVGLRQSRRAGEPSLWQPVELTEARAIRTFLGTASAPPPTVHRRNSMSEVRDVVALVGSLRKESLNRKMAMALRAMAPQSLKLEIVEIGGLPLYNQDLDATPPPAATAFKDRVRKADAVLFVTPEYNRSVPGALKNASDVGSRPKGDSAWSGKPCAIVSVSPGAIGAFGANHHLRQSLVFLDMPAMQQPEAYIGGADKLFDAQGNLTSDSTRSFMNKFLAAFVTWIDHNAVHAA